MRRLQGFKFWLIESILQNEAKMGFSKHIGKNVNEVPPGFWSWLLDNMSSTWTPKIEDDNGRLLTRPQVVQLAKMRADNKPFGDSAPKAVQSREIPPQNTPQSPSARWVLGTVIDVEGLTPGQHIVATKSSPEDWTLMTRNGETKKLKSSQMRTSVSSVKGANDKPIESPDPEKLWAMVREPEVKEPALKTPQTGGNPHILDREKLSEEQKEIDSDFERMLSSPAQNHMMINALAGTGKTTILKHLAWKYGNDRQKWLYLVFNAKNRAEAKETSGGYRKFPDWVEIYTTNSFLGHVMGSVNNLSAVPQTDRITSLNADDQQGGGKRLEKARIMVDGPAFQKLMTDTYHLPSWDKIKDKVPSVLAEFGVRPQRSSGKKKSFFEICEETIERTVDMIRNNFQELSLKLLGLLKSFSIDPRNKMTLNQEVRRVFDKYDVAKHSDGSTESGFFDTSLENIKERISKYKPNFRDIITNVLDSILNYDFMSKNYKDEIIGASTWLLEKSLPKGTDETYSVKKKGATRDMKVNLGDYRDFNDDIWFPTINADKIKFDHYDIVLADEVQDFNEGQKIMLKKLAEAGAKIVAVGDPNQGIYRFRGADNDAFDNLSEMLKGISHDKENWKQKSLSLNFRSRKEVLDFANNNTHVKNLKPGRKFKDDDLPPEVTNGKLKYEEAFNAISKERASGKKIETAFIARTNEPLVHAALKLLGKGIPFAIIGKDVSGDLVKHIFKITKEERMGDNTPLMRFRDSLLQHEEREIDRNSKYSTKRDYLAGLKDITLAMKASIDQATDGGKDQNKTVGDFKKWLKEKLGSNTFDFDQTDEADSERDLKEYREKMEREKPVVLTTAHKSKGLEFNRVYILNSDQFPHPRAKHPEEKAQEANAKYVAYTRAMHQLHILNMEGQPGEKKEALKQPDHDDEY